MTTPFQLGLALIGALLIFAGGAQAQNYPNRTITMVVPFPPGGLTDVPARAFAAMLQQKIGQNVVVENKTGGNGTIGAAYVSRAASDGYTLLANSLADAQNVHFVAVPYSPINDFAQAASRPRGPRRAAVQDAGRSHRRRREKSEQDQLRHLRPGVVAGDGAGPAQQGRRHPDHRRALPGLG
jgi:hypothetical protein